MPVLAKPQQFKVYECRINIRESYNDRPIKPDVDKLNGQTFQLEALWTMGKGDPYPGEIALFPDKREEKEIFVKHGLSWIASGDVELLKQVY